MVIFIILIIKYFNNKMNVSLLSNLQEIKKVYIQLSKKFNLPYDIIKSIFKNLLVFWIFRYHF